MDKELEEKITTIEKTMKKLQEDNAKLTEDNKALSEKLANIRVDSLIKNVEKPEPKQETEEPVEFEFEY